MKGRGLENGGLTSELQAGRGAVVTNSGPRWVWGRQRRGCVPEQESPKRETTDKAPGTKVVATT